MAFSGNNCYYNNYQKGTHPYFTWGSTKYCYISSNLVFLFHRAITCDRCRLLTDLITDQIAEMNTFIQVELFDNFCGQFDGAVKETCIYYVRLFMPEATELIARYVNDDSENGCREAFGLC